MSRFTFQDTPLADLKTVSHVPIQDDRGFLSRLFCAKELAPGGWDAPIAQINHTLTRKRGAVRGFHFQYPPHAEMKLISCLRGKVWDVAVDLRAGSPTFLRWHAEELSDANHRALLMPRGFAHGFQALSDDCELLYFHTAPYMPAAEGALNPRDPALEIDWPLPIADISARDASHALLTSDFAGLKV